MWAELSPASRCSAALLSAPPPHTHSLFQTRVRYTPAFNPLPFSRWGCDAACSVLLFWLFLLCFSELLPSCDYLLHIRRKKCAFSEVWGDCINDLSVTKGKEAVVQLQHTAHTPSPSQTTSPTAESDPSADRRWITYQRTSNTKVTHKSSPATLLLSHG